MKSHRPTLTPSKFTTYLACPAKYRWTFVDARGKWYLRARSTYSFGTTLHKVLETFHADPSQGVPTLAEARASVEENWIDAGYASSEDMADAMGEGKDIVERYVEEMRTLPKVAKTLFVEKSLTFDFPEFRLLGRLDRVDEHEDGSLEIVDYKTGRNSVTAEDVATDLALCTYQLLLAEAFPDRTISATLFALKSGERATYSLSPEELMSFRSDIRLIGMEILAQKFAQLPPVRKRLCERCDFVPLCFPRQRAAPAP